MPQCDFDLLVPRWNVDWDQDLLIPRWPDGVFLDHGVDGAALASNRDESAGHIVIIVQIVQVLCPEHLDRELVVDPAEFWCFNNAQALLGFLSF